MFKLLRYFSVTSLLLIVAAALLLGAFDRHIAADNLLQMGERNNVALTGALSNALRSEFEPLLADDAVAELQRATAANGPQLDRLHAAVLQYTRGLSVVKVKIYNPQGLTIYSSDPRQMGEDKSANQGFRAALQGRAASEQVHRDHFSAFEQTMMDRDLISSYVPVTRPGAQAVYAVFEIYDDVTPLLQHVSNTRVQVMLGVVLVLAALYAILLLIVRRADGIISGQRAQQQRHEQELQTARDLLEQRVLERTAQLEQSNAQLQAEIRERRKTEQQLIEAKHAADEANNAKSQFLANMSHEIRTPMNGVMGMTELLLVAGNLDDEQLQCVEAIHVSADALMHIIDDILDISKIEAGKLGLETADFDPTTIVQQVVDLHTPRAAAKGLRMVCDFPRSLPKHCRGDAGRLRQVLNNLVGNAVKFTQSGYIRVRAVVERRGAGRGLGNRCLLRVEINDSGIGIQPDVQQRLFEPFTQGDDSFSRTYGGTGLGLAICKKLVEMMGGEIGVQSQAGTGSKFWFTVSLETAPHAVPAAPVLPHAAVPGPRGARVLLAEDDLVNQRVAIEMLRQLGCVPTVVTNGHEVIRAWAEGEYDLILMDCHMPDMDGFEATAAIRRGESAVAAAGFPPGPRIPIIAFTAHAMQGDRACCLAAGMDDYLTKPFRLSTLKEKLARWLPGGEVFRDGAAIN